MDELSGVFLQMDAMQTDLADPAPGRQGAIELRDLIPLRQVGIEVVFPGEDGLLVDFATGGDRRAQRQLDRLAVHDGQRSGIAEADRTDLRIRRRAEAGGTAAEDLGGREEPGVYLEANDGFPAHGEGL